MAEYKELQTRLVNRWDDLDTWNQSTLTLLDGEIALAYVEVKTEKTDPDGNVRYDVCPTFVMKVGKGGKKFSELPLLHAPASDVYAWAKDPELLYDSLPAQLTTEIENFATRFGSVDGTQYKDVADLVTAMINQLDASDVPPSNSVQAGAASGKAFVTATIQTNGQIEVTKRYITVDDIPTLPEDKVTNLSELRRIVVGDNIPQGYDKGPVLTRLQNLETVLDGVSTPMDFLGVSTADPKFQPVSGSSNLVVGPEGAITINGSTLTEFQRGDIFAFQSSEYVCVKETISNKGDNGNTVVVEPAQWAFLGDVTATDQELGRLTQRVTQIEKDLNGFDTPVNPEEPEGEQKHTPGVKEKLAVAESDIDNLQTDVSGIHTDINTNIIRTTTRTFDSGNIDILTQGKDGDSAIVLLCCGNAATRAGVDDLTVYDTQTQG